MIESYTRRRVIFAAPYQVILEQAQGALPAPDELLVTTTLSAISAGTELLFYRGQVPSGMSADASIAALANGHSVSYPLAYGYQTVGTVTAVGATVDRAWLGRRVFAFQPHTSHFCAKPADVIPIPAGLTMEQAVLLPNMETAVNFVQDGAPLLGERVVVLGQGVVGLLAAHLLTQFPLAQLTAVDRLPLRRERAHAMGVAEVIAAPVADTSAVDLVFELTGNPDALNDAIALAGYNGRVLIGSWYGQKR
ncbi:MAG: zinc-binding alcohol dehydrogenase [Caldilineaceae bacterium]